MYKVYERLLRRDNIRGTGTLYMEHFVQMALAIVKHPLNPRWWWYHVNDTHTTLEKAHSQDFMHYLNQVDHDIKWIIGGM